MEKVDGKVAGAIPIEIKCPDKKCGHRWTIGITLTTHQGFISRVCEAVYCPACLQACSLETVSYTRHVGD